MLQMKTIHLLGVVEEEKKKKWSYYFIILEHSG